MIRAITLARSLFCSRCQLYPVRTQGKNNLNQLCIIVVWFWLFLHKTGHSEAGQTESVYADYMYGSGYTFSAMSDMTLLWFILFQKWNRINHKLIIVGNIPASLKNETAFANHWDQANDGPVHTPFGYS